MQNSQKMTIKTSCIQGRQVVTLGTNYVSYKRTRFSILKKCSLQQHNEEKKNSKLTEYFRFQLIYFYSKLHIIQEHVVLKVFFLITLIELSIISIKKIGDTLIRTYMK